MTLDKVSRLVDSMVGLERPAYAIPGAAMHCSSPAVRRIGQALPFV